MYNMYCRGQPQEIKKIIRNKNFYFDNFLRKSKKLLDETYPFPLPKHWEDLVWKMEFIATRVMDNAQLLSFYLSSQTQRPNP
jgi:hypothetical protein